MTVQITQKATPKYRKPIIRGYHPKAKRKSPKVHKNQVKAKPVTLADSQGTAQTTFHTTQNPRSTTPVGAVAANASEAQQNTMFAKVDKKHTRKKHAEKNNGKPGCTSKNTVGFPAFLFFNWSLSFIKESCKNAQKCAKHVVALSLPKH